MDISQNPDYAELLALWHQHGSPERWHSLETEGGEFCASFNLTEADLNALDLAHTASAMTPGCRQFFFSDLATALG